MNGYTITAIAEADIKGIVHFIASRDGVDRALHVHDKFVDAFEALSQAPAIGRRKPEFTDDNIRWWPVLGFLVVYDAERSPIDILRVIHGARDLPELFRS